MYVLAYVFFYIFLFLGTVRNRIFISATIKLTLTFDNHCFKGLFTAATTQVYDKYKGWKKWNVSNDVWKLFRSQNKQKKQLQNRSSAINHAWFELSARTKTYSSKGKNDIQAVIRLSESITLSSLLIGEAERELPGDRPAANHTPEEPLLTYKLEPPLSVTQRNQRTEGCKSHTRYNIWKAVNPCASGEK